MSPETAQLLGAAAGAGVAVVLALVAGTLGGWYARRSVTALR